MDTEHLQGIRERVEGIADMRDLYQEVQDTLDLLAEVERLRGANEWLHQVLADAVDVFRRHDCRLDHMTGECHLCEIVHEADAAVSRT